MFDQSDDDGTVVVLVAEPPPELEAAVERAVGLCPNGVIRLVADDAGDVGAQPGCCRACGAGWTCASDATSIITVSGRTPSSLHRLGGRLRLHELREGVHVGHLHDQPHLVAVRRVDEGPGRHPERPEDLLAYR